MLQLAEYEDAHIAPPMLLLDLFTRIKHRSEKPSAPMLKDTLLGLLRLFGPVYIILDALDGCPRFARTRVMSLVQDLLSDFGHICSILFTSRPAEGIESVIQMLSDEKIFVIDLQDCGFVMGRDIDP